MPLTADQLAQVRRMVADVESETWTDPQLEAAAEAFVTDDVYDLRALAASLWEEKAAEWATQVAVSESGSSRAMQQQFDHAIVMAKRFKENSSEGTDPTTQFPRSTRIVRATRGE
jgi:hypothetical protein